MNAFLQDLRLGLRMLRQSPGFSALAILTFALGIGVNVAIFSVVDAVALRGLGVADADRIVRILNADAAHPDRGTTSSWIEVDRFGAASHAFAAVAASDRRGVVVKRDDEAHRLLANVVSDNYFDVMQVTPFRGRTFTTHDVRASGAPPVVVLSYDYWQRQFQGNDAIVGQTIVASDVTCLVLGILPPTFRGTVLLLNPDVYLPISTWLALNPGDRVRLERPQARQLEVFGRLRPDITPQQAAADLVAIQQQLAAEFPEHESGRRLDVKFEADARGSQVGLIGALLFGVAALVLLIAIVNIANLLLVRGEARRLEMATRVALGASRGRTVRQLVTETFVLAAFGAAGAWLLATLVIGILPSLMPPMDFPIGFDFRIDGVVLSFGAVITLVAVGLAGVLPAIATSHLAIAGPLKSVMVVGRRGRWRDAMVVGQIATTVVLLIASGLLVRTLSAIRHLDAGFDTRANMLIASLDLRKMPVAREHDYDRTTLEQLGALPGVESAAIASRIPLWGSGGGAATLAWIPGLPDRDRDGLRIGFAVVSPNYFSTLGTRVVRGRAITADDNEHAVPVTVLNESAARRLWPTQEAIGQHIRLNGPDGKDVEVVGVVQDGRYLELTETQRAYMFFPLFQEMAIFGSRWGADVLVVRTSADAAAQSAAVRRVVRGIDPAVDVLSIRTMEEHIRYALYSDRLVVQLVGSMGVLGLVLAAIGLFGVISYSVTRRIREIGVRIALGAHPREVARLVFARAWWLAGVGIAIGVAVALAAGTAMSSFLYGVSTRDPLTYVAATATMALVAFVASAIPARRAVRIDPIRALRAE